MFQQNYVGSSWTKEQMWVLRDRFGELYCSTVKTNPNRSGDPSQFTLLTKNDTTWNIGRYENYHTQTNKKSIIIEANTFLIQIDGNFKSIKGIQNSY